MASSAPVCMSTILPQPVSLLVAVVLGATLTLPSQATAANQCPVVPAVAKRYASTAGKLKRQKKYQAAAQNYVSAAEAAAACRPRQMQYVHDAVEAFDRATTAGFDAGKCEGLPELAAARLLVRQRRAVAAQLDALQYLQEIDGLLQARDPMARTAAELLEIAQPLIPADIDLTAARDAYRAVVTRFPACAPQLRELVVESTLSRVPATLAAPSCAAPEVRGRRELDLTLDTIASAEPGVTSPGLKRAQQRSMEARRFGSVVEQSQADAVAAVYAGNHAQAHIGHMVVLRTLPECDVYHQARSDALGGAIAALKQIGTREARNDAIRILDMTLREWRVSYGLQVGPDYAVYENQRSELVRQHDRDLAEVAEQARKAEMDRITSESRKLPIRDRNKRPTPGKAASSTKPVLPGVDTSRMSGHIAGLVASGTLTVAFGLTATVLSARLRRKGPIYRDIVDAYLTEDKNPYTAAELCVPSTDASISATCAHHAAVRHSAIAMWSLTAASAVSTIVFTALTAKSSQGRPRKVSFGVSPSRRGAVFTGVLRF